MPVQSTTLPINGLSMHVLHAGKPSNPVIMFLHGFPEAGISWEWHLEYFAQKGFHAIAPDQRGYGRTDKPKGIDQYRIHLLVEDIRQLIVHFSTVPITLVGHDWGGCVAWHLAMQHPELLRQLVIINMPHPSVMQETLLHSSDQKKRSSYIAFFQLPLLPEWLSTLGNHFFLRRMMRTTARPQTFSQRQWVQYLFNWQQKGALRAMINWYRAYHFTQEQPKEITTPTLILWGKKDAFLQWQMAEKSLALCTNGQLKFWEDATHWLYHEYKTEVAEAIEQFMQVVPSVKAFSV
jgi:epoxide hydrolase 4